MNSFDAGFEDRLEGRIDQSLEQFLIGRLLCGAVGGHSHRVVDGLVVVGQLEMGLRPQTVHFEVLFHIAVVVAL